MVRRFLVKYPQMCKGRGSGRGTSNMYVPRKIAIATMLATFSFVRLYALPVVLMTGQTEVVVAPDAPKTVLFAADEMTNVLSQVFGEAVPIVTAPSAGRHGIYLGDSVWTRAAGIDVSRFPRDGFSIIAKGRDVFIAGRDDTRVDFYFSINSPVAGAWDLLNEHATLFGVYEFLERYAHVRFYFPGELGTVVPAAKSVSVPEGVFTDRPDFTVRRYAWSSDGVYFEGENRERPILPGRKLNYVRNRMATEYIPCCHGLNGFRVQQRFAQEHPEYMALFNKHDKGLVRDTDPNERSHHPGQVCHSSAVYDEIFEDICSYARGDGPEVRGMGSWKPGSSRQDWAIGTFRKPWVDIMPQDGMVKCLCERCRAAYNTNEFHYATELIWRRTAELANRLKKAGVDIRITQMAYTPYGRVPDFDLPDNIDVMVAVGGPWGLANTRTVAKEYGGIRKWAEKTGRPVWIWTYPGKHGAMNIANVPSGAPRAWAKYYQGAAPWIFGAYAECGCDRMFYNYLCYYVLGKVCWNSKTDVDALLKEHFRLMFGPAKEEMAAFSDDIERIWINETAGKSIETPLGPQRQAPSPYDIFMRIYSRQTLVRWKGWLDAAAAKVAPNSLEARRIALWRHEMFDPLLHAARDYRNAISVEREVRNRVTHPERKNILVNGDFSQTGTIKSDRHFGIWKNGSVWQGGWIADVNSAPRISFHDDLPDGVKGRAMRIDGDGTKITVQNHFTLLNGRFKAGHRYRVSCFVRLTDVVPLKPQSGFRMNVWCDHNTFFPKNCMTGTTGWIHQSFEFVAGQKSADYESSCSVFFWNATGRVDLADLRLEEVCP